MRWCAALLGAAVAVLLPAGAVLADPAGPTDYRSEILAVDPPTPTVALDILGGDSFVELTVEPGTEVEVIGYRGEPYLRFERDGTVSENTLSPTTYLNAERYGTEFPDFADPKAPPEWREVGTDGRWSWHDHRAHLMQPVPPFGTKPGDRILESVVPLFVDGEEVDVTVISTWQPEPSSVPLWIGGGVGLLVAAAAFVLLARRSSVGVMAGLVAGPALLALVVGYWQYSSLPPETGPQLSWWVLPLLSAIAAGCGLIPFVGDDRLIGPAFLVLAGVLLVTWAWLRRDGLTAAIVPTGAPNGLDRGTTVVALLTGGVAILAALGVFRNSSPAGTERGAATT